MTHDIPKGNLQVTHGWLVTCGYGQFEGRYCTGIHIPSRMRSDERPSGQAGVTDSPAQESDAWYGTTVAASEEWSTAPAATYSGRREAIRYPRVMTAILGAML